ncbi:MAG: STAS domain-containing protein [Polyangiaceae bacterium]|jgi:rsbT co-antagonist protein RsbR|nr:STAS domain-containing protein [Polyangiaceae bacterium]
MTDTDFETLAYDRIADILVVLAEVTSGTFNSRLPDLPEADPFSSLFRGINETVSSLADAQSRSETYQRDLEEKLRTIEQQRLAIRELSTPIIEVWSGVLCLPVVGVMDTTRSAEMTETLLNAIASTRARCVIVDITGIEVMDTATADHFLRMARAIRLLGAECVLTGIKPGIAQTIVQMGVDLNGVVTRRTLRDALSHFVRASVEQARSRLNATEALKQTDGR